MFKQRCLGISVIMLWEHRGGSDPIVYVFITFSSQTVPLVTPLSTFRHFRYPSVLSFSHRVLWPAVILILVVYLSASPCFLCLPFCNFHQSDVGPPGLNFWFPFLSYILKRLIFFSEVRCLRLWTVFLYFIVKHSHVTDSASLWWYGLLVSFFTFPWLTLI